MIDDLAFSSGAETLARCTEVEPGRKAHRPELAKALHQAKVRGVSPLIAKLERLSRNAAVLLALHVGGVRLDAVDMSEANDRAVRIMARVAQAARKAISRRTKEALAVAKARGDAGQSERSDEPASGEDRRRGPVGDRVGKRDGACSESGTSSRRYRGCGAHLTAGGCGGTRRAGTLGAA
ncbi:MAG: recombinase family protein [Rhodobacterales bacterium]|nr:recombinase family protein [Rhodobacterales bacterium]